MRKFLIYSLAGAMLFSSNSYASNTQSDVTAISSTQEVNKEKVADILYNEQTSDLYITPKLSGTTYYSYKINGEYPKYNSDRAVYLDKNGNVIKEEEVNPDDSIFKSDFSNWFDATKVDFIPSVYDSDSVGDSYIYYEQEPVSNDNTITIACRIGDKVTIEVVNKNENGEFSSVQTEEFVFKGMVKPEVVLNEKIEVIDRGTNYETVRITADKLTYVDDSLFNIYYPEEGKNCVDIKLTDNMTYHFQLYSDELKEFADIYYTVEGLTSVDTGETGENLSTDFTPPVITSDAIPESATEGFYLKVYTDEKCVISCNNAETEGSELSIWVDANGSYTVYATDMNGNQSEKTFEINSFKNGFASNVGENNVNQNIDADGNVIDVNSNGNGSNSGQSIGEDTVIDRDSYFDKLLNLTGELPLTGHTGFVTLLVAGLGVAVVSGLGVFFLNKKGIRIFKKKEKQLNK